MLKRTHPLIFTGLVGSDILMTATSWVIAYYFRFQTSFIPVTKGIPPFDTYWKMLTPIVIMWLIIFNICGLYRPRRGYSQAEEFVSIFQAITFGTIMLITFNFFYRQYSYSRLVLLYFWAVNIFAVGISRSLLQDLIAYARSKGYNLRHISIRLLASGLKNPLSSIVYEIKLTSGVYFFLYSLPCSKSPFLWVSV